jgi:hypothetical protein
MGRPESFKGPTSADQVSRRLSRRLQSRRLQGRLGGGIVSNHNSRETLRKNVAFGYLGGRMNNNFYFVAALTAILGMQLASPGAVRKHVYLDSIMAPALARAEKSVRVRPAANATSAQIDLLNASQGAALQRLRGALLGRTVVAVFVVTNVADDKQNGGFDVDGNINLDQPIFYNAAARQAIAAAGATYESTRGYGLNAARVRQQALATIASNAAPPSQQIVVHTVAPGVLSWLPGQTRLVLGTITDLDENVTTYAYPDSFDTNNGGDYAACVVHMHWLSEGLPPPQPRAAARKRMTLPKFKIVLKNGSVIHASSCVMRGDEYEITEFGIRVEIPSSRVISVTKLPAPPKR